MLNHRIMGDGAPILVLHGARLDHRHMMESLEPILAELSGWQRIYLDLPGHGASDGQECIASQDDLLAAVSDFAGTMLPETPFAVIGESRGSYLAEGLAHLHPERLTGVALIVPGGRPGGDPARLPAHVVMEPEPALREGLAPEEHARFDGFMVVQSVDVVEKTRRSKLPALALFDRSQEARVRESFDFSFHARGETRVFDRPSLIVAGRQDSLSGWRDAVDLMQRFPRATLAVLDSAGHGLTWERPDLFAALLRDWLARLAYRAPD